jgi:hypothetical protein
VVSVTDQVGNEETYTVCYIFNIDAGRYIYEFDKSSLITCQLNEWYVGVFGRVAKTYHYIDFQKAGMIEAEGGGTFSNNTSTNGIGGAYISYRFKPMFSVTGKLIFENLNAETIAPYSGLSNKYDSKTKKWYSLQEMNRLKINALFMDVSLSIEWFFDRRLYLTGGINMNTKLYDKAVQIRDAANPGFDYEVTQIYEGPSEMMSPLGANLFAGVGFASTLPIYNEYASVFIEVLYDYGLTNLISDGAYHYGNSIKGSWYINQLALNFGIKYSF